MSPYLRFVVYACAGYVLFTGILFLAQRRMMYFPDSTSPSPELAGLAEVSPVTLNTADGLELLAWYRPAARSGAPTLVFLHGNAGNIGHRGWKTRPYLDAGYGLLLVSWRGYGGNPGSPDEEGLYHDARAALAYLADAGVEPSRIVLYGESLGSGPAVQVATEQRVGAVVLESAFTSAADVAQRHYWYLPARYLVHDRFDSITRIGRIGAPLFIIHGERDTIVPVDMGKALFAAAVEPKEARFIAGAGHNDLYSYGVAEDVLDFLKRTFP